MNTKYRIAFFKVLTVGCPISKLIPRVPLLLFPWSTEGIIIAGVPGEKP